MKIYIVTSGEYSDRGNVGCFDSRESAEEFMKVYPLNERYDGYYDIEEYELNHGLEQRRAGLFPYRVWIELNTGNAETPVIKETPHAELKSTATVLDKTYRGIPIIRCDVWARDSDHAIKIAVELRQAELCKVTE